MKIPSFLENILSKIENELQKFTLNKSNKIYYSRYKNQPMKNKVVEKLENNSDDKNLILKRKWLNNTSVILKRINEEFNIFPFNDKVRKFINKNNFEQFDYRLENGDIIKFIFISEEKFEIKYILNGKFVNYSIKSKRLYSLLKSICEFSETCIDRISTKEQYNTGDPIKDKYNLIIKKIKLREEELNKAGLTNDKREALQNELNNYKSLAIKIKNKITL